MFYGPVVRSSVFFLSRLVRSSFWYVCKADCLWVQTFQEDYLVPPVHVCHNRVCNVPETYRCAKPLQHKVQVCVTYNYCALFIEKSQIFSQMRILCRRFDQRSGWATTWGKTVKRNCATSLLLHLVSVSQVFHWHVQVLLVFHEILSKSCNDLLGIQLFLALYLSETRFSC